jgi:hypothetical protein
LDSQGNSLWSVECKSVEDENGLLICIINISKTNVDVYLETAQDINHFCDLISGKIYTNRFSLQPGEVLLLQEKY